MGDSLFIVDDHNLNSIIYDTQDLWFPTANVDAALQGTLTEGVTGAKASLTFSGKRIPIIQPTRVLTPVSRNRTRCVRARDNGEQLGPHDAVLRRRQGAADDDRA